MKRSFQLFIALLGCLHLCGGPTGLLQGFAWVRMSVEYSSQDGVVEGIKKTFDGEHPCALCRAVEKVKGEQGKSAPQEALSLGKDFKLSKDFTVMTTISQPLRLRQEIKLAARRAEIVALGELLATPLVPPPRRAYAQA